jgi:hypothetical protein
MVEVSNLAATFTKSIYDRAVKAAAVGLSFVLCAFALATYLAQTVQRHL